MNKKIVALVLACVLMFSCIVAGTLAYLQVKTESIVNTFTFGDVSIALTETTGDSYKLVPGQPVTKDPTVTVTAGNEACWVFVKVDKSNFDDFATFEMGTDWSQLIVDETPVDGVYYKELDATVSTGSNTVLPVIKDNTVTCKSDIEKDDIKTAVGANAPKLTFTAYAIQKDGFASAQLAWALAETL